MNFIKCDLDVFKKNIQSPSINIEKNEKRFL